jgi:hypothetical protein
LPGITRIDVKGQKDVEKVTTEMAAEYCSNYEDTVRIRKRSSCA